MAADLGQLGEASVALRVALDKFQKDLDSARKGTATATGDMEKKTRRVGTAFNAVGAQVRRVAGTIVAALTIRAVVRYADAYTQVQNALRVTGTDTDRLADATRELFDIASRTRTPIQAIAQLYQRASVAAGELGVSQQELLQFTETIGQALATQGGSAAAASGALIQLAQAMGSGIVRAEEFNSILEGAFPIAQAAARGIEEAGGSVAKLRSLIIEGEISSREFFEGIQSQAPQIAEAFQKAVPTVGQAFSVLDTALTEFVGSTEQAGRGSEQLARAIIALSATLRDPETQRAAQALFTGLIEGANLAIEALATLNNAIGSTVGAILEAFGLTKAPDVSLEALAPPEIVERLRAMRAETEAFAAGTRNLGDSVGDAGSETEDALEKMQDAVKAARLEADLLEGDFSSVFEAAAKIAESSGFIEGLDDMVDASDDVKGVLGELVRELGRLEEASALNDFQQALADARFAADLLSVEFSEGFIAAAEAARASGLIETLDDLANLTGEAGEKFREFKEQAERSRDLEDARQVIADTALASEVYADKVERLNELLASGLISQEQFNAAVRQAEDDMLGLGETADPALEAIAERLEFLTSLGTQFARTLSSGFAQAIVQSDDLGEAIQRMTERLAEAVLEALLFQAITQGVQALSGAFGPAPVTQGTASFGGPGPTLAEKGAVFDMGRLVPFARGGIVTAPTVFPMAQGAGLMGEAGPEGVLPLRRTAGGDLGVSAAGLPRPELEVNIYGAPPETRTERDEQSGRVDVFLDEAMARNLRPGTATSRAMQQQFGLGQRTTRR